MCGFFGYFGPPDAVPTERAAIQALASIAHRGPDAQGILRMDDRGLLIGHARLSIIDPQARSDQPFRSGAVVTVFNGEIFNYRQLREQLLAEGVQLRTNGDTEVIVEGYRRWGTGVFGKLQGMFAIVLHDSQKNELHLARDDFGIKPLCVLHRAGALVFASEVKAIAALRSLSVRNNLVGDLLAWGFQLEDASVYDGVEYLTPGTVRTFHLDQGVLRVGRTERLWSPAASYASAGRGISSEGLRQVIEQSVEDHLVADVPVAVSLSGGLDSSIVAACAAKRHPGLHAFTFTVASGTDPEVEHASLLSRQLGLRSTVARILPVPMERWLRRVAWHMEEPIANINSLLGYCLASVVAHHGMKVVLVGEGSDELFGGYPWYRFSLASQGGADGAKVLDAYRNRRAQAAIWRVLRPEARAEAQRRFEAQRREFAARPARTPLDRFLAFDQATQLQYSQLLRVDRTFMAFGVEARVPFLYRPVHAASATLPDEMKIRPSADSGRGEKVALGQAFEGMLPSVIANRPKYGEQGTVNLWNSWVTERLAREFERCLHSAELAGARQLLSETVDWRAAAAAQLAPKEKFALSMLIEGVDAVLLARTPVEKPEPIPWEPVTV